MSAAVTAAGGKREIPTTAGNARKRAVTNNAVVASHRYPSCSCYCRFSIRKPVLVVDDFGEQLCCLIYGLIAIMVILGITVLVLVGLILANVV